MLYKITFHPVVIIYGNDHISSCARSIPVALVFCSRPVSFEFESFSGLLLAMVESQKLTSVYHLSPFTHTEDASRAC